MFFAFEKSSDNIKILPASQRAGIFRDNVIHYCTTNQPYILGNYTCISSNSYQDNIYTHNFTTLARYGTL